MKNFTKQSSREADLSNGAHPGYDCGGVCSVHRPEKEDMSEPTCPKCKHDKYAPRDVNGICQAFMGGYGVCLCKCVFPEPVSATFCHAPGDEGAEFCGDPESLHCGVLGDAAFWESVEGQEHLVKCMRDDHLIHHPFVPEPVPSPPHSKSVVRRLEAQRGPQDEESMKNQIDEEQNSLPDLSHPRSLAPEQGLMRMVSDALSRLAPIAAKFETKPEHWIHEWDEGLSFCFECAEKKVAELLAEEPNADYLVDGGWGSAGDSQAFCETCECALDNSFTTHACEQELDHFETCGFHPTSPEDCHSLMEILHATGGGDLWPRVEPLVRAALAAIENNPRTATASALSE